MFQLAVVHMITYSHLLSLEHLVSNALIVWFNLESNVCQTICELTVVQKACNHHDVQRVLALYQKLFHILFVGCDVGVVNI